MSRNVISANPEHYIFKIFRGKHALDPLEDLKNFFSLPRGSKFFQDRLPPLPQTKNPR